MSVRKIRQIIRKATGFDVHRHHPERDKFVWLTTLGIETVIDVGANEGQTATEMRKRFPGAEIFSFEPLKECYDALVRNMAGDARFKAFNVGVGDKAGAMTMHRNPYSQSSSILQMEQLHKDTFPQSRGEERDVQIKIVRLDDMPEMAPGKLKKGILFKIDVQGFEDKVIRGSERILRDTKLVLIENSFMSLYKGQPLFADIYRMLTDLGFTYRGSLWQKLDPKSGAVMFEDSLFLRE